MENQKKQVQLPEELQKKYEAAESDQERSQILREFAGEMGAEAPAKKEAAQLTQEQFRQFLEKVGSVSAENAKAAVKAVSEDVEQRYGLPQGEAREVAESSFSKAEQRHRNQRQDWQMAANVFRGMYLARMGKPDQYQRALEEEAEYTRKTYNRESRAMTLGTDSTGGYLAPEQFSDMLYENIARESHVMKYSTIIQMDGNEVIRFPKLTASLSAEQTAEGTGITESQPTFSQATLETKKLATLSKPVSVEMIEKANPAIIPLLLKFATIEIMKKQDELVFGTTGDGIRASSTNEVTGFSAASGYSAVDYDYMANLEAELDPQYTPGDDITGSGIVSGQARFWIPHKLRNELVKKKDGNNVYLDEARELRNDRKIFGWEAKRVLSLPDGSSLSENDKVAVFGDLSYNWVGVEPGFRIKILEEGTVDSTELGATGNVAVRVMQFFDNVVIDDESFSQLKLVA